MKGYPIPQHHAYACAYQIAVAVVAVVAVAVNVAVNVAVAIAVNFCCCCASQKNKIKELLKPHDTIIIKNNYHLHIDRHSHHLLYCLTPCAKSRCTLAGIH